MLDASPPMQIRLAVTDLQGNAISSIPQGENFLIQAFVHDLRLGVSDPNFPWGVAAAFLDVNYDASKVTIDPGATITRTVFNAQSVADSLLTPGLIDEVGGVNPTTTLTGFNELLLFKVTAQATAQGTFFLDASPADLAPRSDNIIYVSSSGIPSVVPTSQVLYIDSPTVTITEPGAKPTIAISDATVVEGNAGFANMVFTVSRTGDLNPAVVVGYRVVDGTATAGLDYSALPTGTVTIAAGATSATITIAVTGDTLDEVDETFSVALESAAFLDATSGIASKVDLSVGDQPFSVAVGDLNGDGKPDMAVANLSSNNVSIRFNTTPAGAANSTFAATQNIATGFGLKSVSLGDLNGDGKLDMVVANRFSGSVSVLFSTIATGSMTASFGTQQVYTVNANPNYIALGDLNSDGRLDIAVANRDVGNVSVLLNSTTPGNTTPSFAAKTDFTVGSQPTTVALVDLNGDGWLDIASANLASNNVSVLVNNMVPGATTASFVAHQDFAAGSGAVYVAAADINGDGKQDLITANSGANNISALLGSTVLGSTTISFGAAQNFTVGTFPRALAVADYNNDGLLDVAVANRNSNSMSVLIGSTGPGSSIVRLGNRQDYATGTNPDDVAAYDLNGDGKLDLAYTNENSDNVSVFMNTDVVGGQTFGAPTNNFPVADDPRAVAVGDLNGDGKPDIVAGGYGTNSVSVLLNTTLPGGSASTFAPRVDLPIVADSKAVALGDLNGDGLLDVVVANYNSTTLSIFLNTTAPGATTPSFAPRQDTPGVFTRSTAVVVEDFNGDGVPDLAVASRDSNAVSVFVNTTARGATTLTFGTRRDFGTASSPRSLVAVDLNGDGRLDLAAACFFAEDISVLLNTTAAGAGNATFSTKTDFDAGPGAFFLAAGDLNGDGRPDLAVSRNSAVSPSLQVFLNTTTPGAATPTLATRQDLAAQNNIGVALADFDKDGRLDLAFASRTSIVGVLPNTTALGSSTVTAGTQKNLTVGNPPRALTVGDFNLDGLPDIVAVNQNDDTVSVVLNSRVTISDGVGVGTITDDDTALQVNSLTATATGFVAQLTRTLETSELNLYDQGSTLGPADLTLTGATTGEVRGSLVVDSLAKTITFIKSGGVLPADSYTVTIKSGATAFKDTTGLLLDGNRDAVGGDNYNGGFVVTSPAGNAVTLSIPDFARGYGQSVTIPGATSGIPISISNAQGVKSVAFTLIYNPALLTLGGATIGAGISGSVTLDTSVPGSAQVSVTSASGLSMTAGEQVLINLNAQVPIAAPYAAKQILDLTNLHIFDTSEQPASLPAIDNDGIHIAAYFGDANGSQSYNSPDATLAQRMIVGTNSGLSAYQLADPYLIVDITGNGQVQSNDITLIQRAIVGTTTTQIPPHPGLSPVASGGPDPLVSIPQNLTASVGGDLSVPVEILVTDPAGITLSGADLAVAYDPAKLVLTDVQLGALLVGFGISANTSTPGVVRLSVTSSDPLALTHGSAGILAELHFTVIAGVDTASNLNLLQSSGPFSSALYDNRGRPLTLAPAPTNGDADEVDGRVHIVGPIDPRNSPAQVVDAVIAAEQDWNSVEI